jgi:thiol-disulfide isomerase/thioredoxin
MRGASRLLAALTAAAVVLTLGACTGSKESACTTNADGVIECPPDARTPAPPVKGELLDGTAYDLAATRGNVVVLNFWGSWCAPCRAEIDDLENMYKATKASGVDFLGVNGRDGRDQAKAFQQGRVTYPSLFDPSGRLSLDFDVPPNNTPSTIVLDRAGRIAVVVRNAIRREAFQPYVERIAAEAS